LSTVSGNPDLEPERTVMYEAGLQQAFSDIISLDFTVYYRDIRNLLATQIIRTREGYQYARYINRDYGNVKGFIVSLDKRFSNYFGCKLDYTYQIASGVSSDPQSEYYNNQASPPIQTNTKVVPLNWDQRSTLNFSLTVGEQGNWNIGLVLQYGSGFPYTPDTRFTMLRFENRDLKPATFNADLRADKSFSVGGMNLTIFALVYNLFDTKNEINVDAASGRTNLPIFTTPPMPIIGMNTLQEYLNNPSNYSAPRQMRVGMSFDF
jgi:outer membrane receptor protein involved in Fe transport